MAETGKKNLSFMVRGLVYVEVNSPAVVSAQSLAEDQELDQEKRDISIEAKQGTFLSRYNNPMLPR